MSMCLTAWPAQDDLRLRISSIFKVLHGSTLTMWRVFLLLRFTVLTLACLRTQTLDVDRSNSVSFHEVYDGMRKVK